MGPLWKLTRAKDQILGAAVCRTHGVELGSGVQFFGAPIVSRWEGSRISIGSRSVLVSDSRATALGVRGPVILRTLAAGAELLIGDDVGMSGSVVCAASSVTIGASSLLGADVMIFDTDFHPLDTDSRRYTQLSYPADAAAVVVSENVFIGARSIICKGVTIGRNAVIGAGSVVTRSVPENSVFAGVPAVFVRDLAIGDNPQLRRG